MAESSQDRYTYERKIVERFGGQQVLDLIVPAPAPASESRTDGSPGLLFEHAEENEAAN
jgi:hypothetical protein